MMEPSTKGILKKHTWKLQKKQQKKNYIAFTSKIEMCCHRIDLPSSPLFTSDRSSLNTAQICSHSTEFFIQRIFYLRESTFFYNSPTILTSTHQWRAAITEELVKTNKNCVCWLRGLRCICSEKHVVSSLFCSEHFNGVIFNRLCWENAGWKDTEPPLLLLFSFILVLLTIHLLKLSPRTP